MHEGTGQLANPTGCSKFVASFSRAGQKQPVEGGGAAVDSCSDWKVI